MRLFVLLAVLLLSMATLPASAASFTLVENATEQPAEAPEHGEDCGVEDCDAGEICGLCCLASFAVGIVVIGFLAILFIPLGLKKQASGKGFTVIELIIAVAIIGAIASIAIPSFLRGEKIQMHRVGKPTQYITVTDREGNLLIQGVVLQVNVNNIGPETTCIRLSDQPLDVKDGKVEGICPDLEQTQNPRYQRCVPYSVVGG